MSKRIDTSDNKQLRLLPGVVIVALQWFGRFVVPEFNPDWVVFGLLSAVIGAVALLVWWLFFSRVPHAQRWIGLVLLIAATYAATPFLHESITTGMMGAMYMIYAIPTASLALVAGAALGARFSGVMRFAAMTGVFLLAALGWTLVKTGGFTSDLDHDFSWRWSETHEDRLVAMQADAGKAGLSAAATGDEKGAWPGFRGAARNSTLHNASILTDWQTSPPEELWRQLVGPGWSSFAVLGEAFFTQEQRGEQEMVSCYNINNGKLIWQHADNTRFWESNAGAGPRGTPALHQNRVYTFGATGIVNALDAASGSRIWSRDAGKDAEMKLPHWGFASSPLVVDDVVIIAVGSRLVGYDITTGDLLWRGPKGGSTYSSPHLLTIGGAQQVLLSSWTGVVSLRPGDGELLWEYPWEASTRIAQPAQIEGGDLLLSEGEEHGLRRVNVSRNGNAWQIKERWTTIRLKPYQSDFVVHKDHAYGFDGSILACIDLEEGKRQWKGGRYGKGQLILLADQDLMIVISERGELALVSATPDGFAEVARIPSIKGKTWNHPVLAGDILLVRNGYEMVGYRLTMAKPTAGIALQR